MTAVDATRRDVSSQCRFADDVTIWSVGRVVVLFGYKELLLACKNTYPFNNKNLGFLRNQIKKIVLYDSQAFCWMGKLTDQPIVALVN